MAKRRGPGRPPSDDPGVRISVRLPRSVIASTTALASRQGVTVSAVIREAVETAIARGSSR